MSLVLVNARVPGSDDLLNVEIADGRIRHLGYIDSPGVLSARVTDVVDLGERWLIPGLWDNHVHFSQWAQTARRLDLSSADSAATVVAAVAERMLAAQPGETLIGYGFRDGLWPDAPEYGALDRVSGDVPVVLVSGDLHSCWLNSAALAQYGFAPHPTGLLQEDDCFRVVQAIGTVADEVLDSWADDAARLAATRGVVGIVDLEMAWNLGVWTRRIEGGTDSLRVEFGIYTEHLDRAIGAGLRTGDVIPGTQGLLSVGPYKVLTDGSLNTRTAYCADAYEGLEGTPGSHGVLTVQPEDLVGRLRRAVDAGIRATVHAIGDRANTLALDAFEQVGATGSIEHAQLLAREDLARFAELGVTASVQPAHALDDREIAERYWAGRTERSFMLAGLLNSGAHLALGSDAPVSPLDPWVTMAAAVGRSRDGHDPWHPEQAISRQAALAASARGRHTIEIGDVADLAVCEIDPFTASVPDLMGMPVAATLIAGRFTHSTL
jgi:hypothetical protein